MDEAVFYRDWLSLDKGKFRILAMIAGNGAFSGNLSDMCECLSISSQTRNRNKLKTAIQELEDGGWIEAEQTGRTFHLKPVPRGTEIHLPREWMETIMRREYGSAAVAWEVVLKVLLWLVDCGDKIVITDRMIAEEIGLSDSTVSAAKKVLRKDFQLLKIDALTIKREDGTYWRIGHTATINAWLSTE